MTAQDCNSTSIAAATTDQKARLFCGVFSTGIRWADRTVECDGDYKHLTFMPFATLQVEFQRDCPIDMRCVIEVEVAGFQKHRGEKFDVSSCGQTVILGDR